MAKTVLYKIKRNGKYLQTIDANDKYCKSGTAPTMGVRHSWNEYKTIWGDEPRGIEPLSAISYLRTLLEEYRWEEKKPIKIEIIPYITELFGNSEQLVETNNILVRDKQEYEVVIADDNIFVICPIVYDKTEQSKIVKYDKAEIYANQSSINTLEELRFEKWI